MSPYRSLGADDGKLRGVRGRYYEVAQGVCFSEVH